MTIAYSRLAPSVQLPMSAVPDHAPALRPTPEASERLPAALPDAGAQAKGDSELAGRFAQMLRTGQSTGQFNDIENIPPASAFGQWWSHLHNVMKNPHFVSWANQQGIDLSKSIEINHRDNSIAAIVGGQRKGFSGFNEGYLWTSMMTPIMQAAKALTSNSPYIFSPTRTTSASYRAVADFYGEGRGGLNREGAGARAAELEHSKTFDLAEPAAKRSEEALEQEKAKLAEAHDQRQVAFKLADIIVRAEGLSETLAPRLKLHPSDRFYLTPRMLNLRMEQFIRNELSNASITLHADSPHRQLQESAAVSLENYIGDNDWSIPKNRDELLNIARLLTTPPLSQPTLGNLGGALSWPIPLSSDDRQSVKQAISQNTLGISDLQNYDERKGVLDYLTRHQQYSSYERNNPQSFIEKLLARPKAQALGLALQEQFNGVSTPQSINDWTLGALGASLDEGSETGSTLSPVRTGVAGFDLARPEHWGKHPSTVAKGLASHLVAEGKASAEMASIAAHLLLSRRAPAFLVKDIPDKVTYGSHTWVSFSTAVARLEAQAPGSTARMTFAQVMQRADLAPVTDEGRRVERAAQREALKDWGVANGVIQVNTQDNYTDDQMSRVFNAFNAQVGELSEASRTHAGPLPERKEMALMELKRLYGDEFPFEEKNITAVPERRDYPGPYSVLDLYLKGYLHARPDEIEDWSSPSDEFHIRDIQANADRLPDINARFNTELSAYFSSVEKAIGTQVKFLIAQQPLLVREDFEYGKIKIVKAVDVARLSTAPIARQRVNENCLLIQTERNGRRRTYELDLKNNRITESVKEKDLIPEPDFLTRPLSDNADTRRDYDEVIPDGQYTAGLTDKHDSAETPNNFTSPRSQYIADAVVKDTNIRALANEAKGETTFDTEVPFYKKAREFMLNLIPLRSTIQNFVRGEIGQGVRDLIFDAFGFAVGIGAAAKGGKVLLAGASASSKLAHGVKIVGRATLGSLNPLSGIEDVSRALLNGGLSVFRKARSALTRVHPVALSKTPGIARGTLKAAKTADEGKLFAKFDDTTGHWYSLNLQTKQSYGMPLENFKPDAMPVETLRNNLQKLHDKLGSTGLICYEKAMFVGMADNALPLKTRQAVLGSLNISTTNTSNYTPRYKELMGVSPETTKSTFSPADIKESGVINFISRNEGGRMVHTAYIQRGSDDKLYLYSTNQADLDLAMYKATGKVETSAGALVSNLDNEGLQGFLDKGYDFVFTPNSSLNANVGRLAA